MQPKRGEALFELTVPGQAAGAGSKTAQPIGKRGSEKRDKSGRLILLYRHASELTGPWMEKVQEAAEREWSIEGRKSPIGPINGALWLDVAFYEERPKAHRYSDGRLKPEAPAYPHITSTHDIDKLRRAISDSLTAAGVIADDKRIVAGGAWKFYADEEPYAACAVIRLGQMEAQTVEEAEIASPPPPGQEQLA